MRLNKKTIVLLVCIVVAFVFYKAFLSKNPDADSVVVVKGNIVREIFESGVVKSGQEINLGFKTPGRIDKISVLVGQEVEKGTVLAKLEDSDLHIQLSQAKDNLISAEVNLKKLIQGPTVYDVEITRTVVENSEKALNAAESNLANTETLALKRIDNAYQNVLVILNNAVLASNNTYNLVDDLIQTYFIGFYTEETSKARSSRDVIEELQLEIKNHRDLIAQDPSQKNINEGLSIIEASIRSIFSNLDIIISACESDFYKHSVSSEEVALLRLDKSTINQILSSVSETKQSISLIVSLNNLEINIAQSQFFAAQGAFNQAKNEFLRLTSPPREEDKNLYEARVRQAKSEVLLLENQISNALLVAPAKGQVLDIFKKEREVIGSGESLIYFLSDSAFQVEVNIYERDVSEIEVGHRAEVELVAFPGLKIGAEIVSIDPAGRIIDGVVYYKTLLDLKDFPLNIKPSMTADIVIITLEKKDVLIIPESALIRGKTTPTVNVLNRSVSEREIEIGVRGTNRMIEVVSGLLEGDKIIVK